MNRDAGRVTGCRHEGRYDDPNTCGLCGKTLVPHDPRRQVIDEAHRVLAAARRVGFSIVAQRRMEQAIDWMESEASRT